MAIASKPDVGSELFFAGGSIYLTATAGIPERTS